MSDRKILEYKIVSGLSGTELTREVQQSISKGWEPFGSFHAVAMANALGIRWCEMHQAMARYEESA